MRAGWWVTPVIWIVGISAGCMAVLGLCVLLLRVSR